jgi:hypothetical protein
MRARLLPNARLPGSNPDFDMGISTDNSQRFRTSVELCTAGGLATQGKRLQWAQTFPDGLLDRLAELADKCRATATDWQSEIPCR